MFCLCTVEQAQWQCIQKRYVVELVSHLTNYDTTCLEAGCRQIFNVYAFIFDTLRITATKTLSENEDTCFHTSRVRSKKHQVVTVLRSPHVNKKSREQFFKRCYIRRVTAPVFLRPQKCFQLRVAISGLQTGFSKHLMSLFALQFRSSEVFKYRLFC
jgi:hypothetical protein